MTMIKISIFKNSFAMWIDASKRTDCLWVFDITEAEKEQIEKWCSYEIVSWKLIVSETTEYTEKIKTEANEKIREDKRIAIEKIATPSDQLNIIASILNTLTSPEPDLNLIADAKSKFAEIETVLAIPYIK